MGSLRYHGTTDTPPRPLSQEGSFVGLVDRIERRLEGAVNGVFSRAFKGDVQPVEIASSLQREIDSEVRRLSRGADRRVAPNDFTVALSPHDYDRLAPYSRTLNAEIVPTLREHAAGRGAVFSGPITIGYIADTHLVTGRIRVTSETLAGVAGASDTGRTAFTQPLVLEVNGVRHPLVPPGFTIGRGSEADLRINDPGVSRLHARLDVGVDEVGGTVITLVDLGSTNGVVVDGRKVAQAHLRDGSRIELGSTRMLVHSPVGE